MAVQPVTGRLENFVREVLKRLRVARRLLDLWRQAKWLDLAVGDVEAVSDVAFQEINLIQRNVMCADCVCKEVCLI